MTSILIFLGRLCLAGFFLLLPCKPFGSCWNFLPSLIRELTPFYKSSNHRSKPFFFGSSGLCSFCSWSCQDQTRRTTFLFQNIVVSVVSIIHWQIWKLPDLLQRWCELDKFHQITSYLCAAAERLLSNWNGHIHTPPYCYHWQWWIGRVQEELLGRVFHCEYCWLIVSKYSRPRNFPTVVAFSAHPKAK